MKPIKIEQICDLKQVSFHENIPFYKFGKTVFQNSHIITIHETNLEIEQFVAYDFQEKKILYKLPSRADSILIHENMKIAAFRQFNFETNTTNIQIFNLEQKQKLVDKHFDLKVEFWKFLKDRIIIVSQTSVSYLDIQQEQDLNQLFERSGQFQQNPMQIIGIDSDQELNWLALKGLSMGNQNVIEGHILLYKRDKNITQYVSGFAVAFGGAKLHSDNYQSSLVVLSQNGTDQDSKKIIIQELDTSPDGYQKFRSQVTVHDQQMNDLPLFLHIFQNSGMVMLITKSGFLQIYEISEQVKIFSEKITNGTIFAGIQNIEGDVFYVITNEGRVLSISIQKHSLTNYLVNQYNQDEKIINLAEKLSFKYNIPHYYEIQQQNI